MASRSGHELGRRLADAAPGSSTLAARLDPRHLAETTMFGDVPDAIRLQMELVACGSASPEDALPQVVALLVPGDHEARRAAIVEAISTNEPLREQWERTWDVLRR